MPNSPQISPVPQPSQVFIVEDHPVFSEGLAQLISSENDLKVCGAAGTVDKALKQIAGMKSDLVLVDISLPGKSGLEFIKEIRKVNRDIKLLVVSMHDEALYADRVLRAGGDGYIMKQENPEEIVHAIRDVLGGRIYVSEQVLAGGSKTSPKKPPEEKPSRLDRLSDSELEILELLGRGQSNREIARDLHSNVKKVAAHIARMKRKLKLASENALIRYAVCWVEAGMT